jgi:4-diphosphocytidyl-2-C-methyl-D-erythritol kinase
MWPAPAKLNLMLRITGRRADGYHELQTVFQFLDVCDELRFQVRQNQSIRCTGIPGLDDRDNLIVHAAKLLQATTHTRLGCDIHIHKKLPMGGGLGGGSSDAATSLLALNRLWGTGLETAQLAELGLQLGADVPVFLYGQAAWAEGIGEKTTPISLSEPWYLVLTPPVHVSTGEIFCDSRLTRDADRIKIRDFLSGQHNNDCLPIVRNRYPEVGHALDWLGNYADARLTGTGACIFAAFQSRQEAEVLLSKTPEGLTGFVARGLNQSPVNELLR